MKSAVSVIVLIQLLVCLAFAAIAAGDVTEDLNPPAGAEQALFAGGCFWCMEPPFERLDGVYSVVSGYSGGTTENPTYQNYAEGGHIEVVLITYDPDRISYTSLLDVFWRQINPTDGGGQFVDRGPEYASAIFYLNDRQKRLAEASKQQLATADIFDKPLVTPILAAKRFWPAEDYHQDYYKKRSIRYKYYRSGSGRDRFLDRVWRDKSFKTTP